MEVILLKDVKNIGKKGETKKVNDGYANNYLIKNGLAVKKSQESLAVLQKELDEKKAQEEKLKNLALINQKKLENITLEFKVKSQGNGNMAGTISTKEIEEKLKKEFNIVIDKRKFIEKYPVNAFGYTNLKIELFKDIIGTIRVHVSEE